jgi:hypothetical protein
VLALRIPVAQTAPVGRGQSVGDEDSGLPAVAPGVPVEAEVVERVRLVVEEDVHQAGRSLDELMIVVTEPQLLRRGIEADARA